MSTDSRRIHIQALYNSIQKSVDAFYAPDDKIDRTYGEQVRVLQNEFQKFPVLINVLENSLPKAFWMFEVTEFQNPFVNTFVV